MKVAILIPAFNASSTIQETLVSIQAQAPESLQRIDQVLLVDDCSTDNTAQVARQVWTLPTPALEIRSNPTNSGERATCNWAFRYLWDAGYSWCLVLHADDLAKSNWLALMLENIANASGSVASICSSWDDFYEDGRIVAGEDCLTQDSGLIEGSLAAAQGTLRNGCWWHFSGCAIHLPSFFEIGPFDQAMPQLGDLDWLIKALLKPKDIIYIQRTLILYRSSAGNVSSTSFRLNRDLREAVKIAKRYGTIQCLQPAVAHYLQRQVAMASRRTVVRLLQGKPRSAFSAGLILMDAMVSLAVQRIRLISRSTGFSSTSLT